MPDFIRLRVKITNGLGLHLRPAGRLVRLAQQFRSEVQVSCNGRVANGKSILDLMRRWVPSAALGSKSK